MKIFLLTFVVLIGVNHASAQVDSAQARSAQAKALYYFNLLTARAALERDIFRNEIVSQGIKLISQMTYTKNVLSSRFSLFGSKGLAKRTVWIGAMDDYISGLKSQLSLTSVDSMFKLNMNQLYDQVVEPRFAEIEAMKTAINSHTTLISCWNNNEKVIGSMADKLIKEAQPIIDAEFNKLKSKLIATTSNIKSIGDVFNQDLIICKTDSVCGMKYIELPNGDTTNYGKLVKDIGTEVTAAKTAIATSLNAVFTALQTKCTAAVAEYTAGPYTQIRTCLGL